MFGLVISKCEVFTLRNGRESRRNEEIQVSDFRFLPKIHSREKKWYPHIWGIRAAVVIQRNGCMMNPDLHQQALLSTVNI